MSADNTLQAIAAPPSYAMDAAPIEPGKEFGPCLLLINCAYPIWVIGGWDGENWHDSDGFLATPVRWSPLPMEP